MATKKKAAPKKGIVLTNGKTGIIVNVYAGNGRHLFRATGYNNVANAMKGISALHQALDLSVSPENGLHVVTDMTKPAPKKAATKKKA